MPIYKVQAGRIITVESSTWVGDRGVIWYDGTIAELRLGDGVTPGGRVIGGTIIQSDVAPYPSTNTIWYNTCLLYTSDAADE